MSSRLSRFLGVASVAAAVFVGAQSTAAACSCVVETLESAWFDSTDTFSAEVLGRQVGRQQVYQVKVTHTYKGCVRPGDVVFVETPIDEAACGQTLAVGSEVLLTATASSTAPNAHTYSINLCGFNRPTSTLTPDQRDFLAGRFVECEDRGVATCADGTDPVACFVDPCSVTVCNEEPNACRANYCGGCNAEFWDPNGFPVCDP